jgi:hypothetical protein
MDEINIGPKREFRLRSGRWLLVVAAVALIAATATVVVTIGGGRSASSGSARGSAGNPVRLMCDETSNPPQMPRPGDLVVGPLWIINARQSVDPKGGGPNLPHEYKYPIGVRPGAIVTVMIAPSADGHVVIENPYVPYGVTAATYQACSPSSVQGWSVFVQYIAFTNGQTRGCVPLIVRTGSNIRHVTISLLAGDCRSRRISSASPRLAWSVRLSR